MKSKTIKLISAVIVLGTLTGIYFGVKSFISKQEQITSEIENEEEELLLLTDMDTSAVNKIVVEKKDFSYMIELDEKTGFWDISDTEHESETADSAKISNFLSLISALEYDEFIDYQADERDNYGLEKPYAMITVDYTEEKEVQITEEGIGEGNEEDVEKEIIEKQLIVYVGVEDGNGGRYVTVNDSDQIYIISLENLDEITEKDASDFWSLLVNYVSVNNLDNLYIQVGDKQSIVNVSRETSIDEDGNETELLNYELDGEKMEDTDFITFYNKLINIVAQERVSEQHNTREKPVMTVEFTDLNGNILTVYYYEKDANYYKTIVGDKVYLVNKMVVREVMNAYETMISIIQGGIVE